MTHHDVNPYHAVYRSANAVFLTNICDWFDSMSCIYLHHSCSKHHTVLESSTSISIHFQELVEPMGLGYRCIKKDDPRAAYMPVTCFHKPILNRMLYS